jgi:hypothetical protein
MSLIDRNSRRFARGLRWAASGMAALAMTGCSVYHTEVDGNFSGSALTSLGSGAGIPLQVDGVVNGSRGDALAAAVAGSMPTSVEGAPVRYAPCDPYTECAGDHVVWTFGPPAARPTSVYPSELHFNADWIGSYQPSPANVTAKVALFQGGTVVSSTSGQVDAPNGADDPAFRAMVAEMSQAIFSSPGWLDHNFR